ncbi:MAG: hypothetical protein WCZ47_01755 [Bacilli bacterium]|jgi:hypothetical protein
MKYKVPGGALLEIQGPEQTRWVGNLKFKIIANGKVVGYLRGQKTAQFFVEKDTKFTVQTCNTSFPLLETSFISLSLRPTIVKLHLLGSSKATAKLGAYVTHGESYFKK